MRPKIVVLVSGSGTILQALLDEAAKPEAAYSVAAVISDTDSAYGLTRAKQAGVPTAVVAPGNFPDRATWDGAVAQAVATFQPDLVVLAGFMRLLGDAFLQRYGGRTINSHPALLPAFPGPGHQVMEETLAYGVKITGASIILIDAGVDDGPIIAQHPVPVLPHDTPDALQERIKEVERVLVVDVVSAMLRDGWKLDGRHVTLGTLDEADDDGEANEAADADRDNAAE